ncbi:hypothetical protein SAMN05216238_1127 [Lentibacillus persicus]|uniref:Uncharacterized protein n=1 Tax=Lentibacillus persicus TaxID=640948 RepID=A0A1I1Z988_9BACI|nr:hypothetical protein [Lentibacillus persicus]SFE28259.1 hypothetical protein SAMN05216238_1127 [Lentibacillus persicus]
MSKGLKIMLFWSLGFPVIITFLRIITDYFLGRDIELLSYSAVFLGIVAAGLIFAGPLNYFIPKSQEN